MSQQARHNHSSTVLEHDGAGFVQALFFLLVFTAAAISSYAQGPSFTFSSSNSQNNDADVFVGQAWHVGIDGATPFSVVQNCMSWGCTNYGSTDVNGNWGLSGSFPDGIEGLWVENWSTNGAATEIAFYVHPATCTPIASGDTSIFSTDNWTQNVDYPYTSPLGYTTVSISLPSVAPSTLEGYADDACSITSMSASGDDGRLAFSADDSEMNGADYSWFGYACQDEAGGYSGSATYYASDPSGIGYPPLTTGITLSVSDDPRVCP
jgi:hypothetical protein